MKFSVLYKNNIDKFPDEIDVSDVVVVKNDAIYSHNLSRIMDSAVDDITPTDELNKVMLWAIFQTIHAQLWNVVNSKNKIIHSKSIIVDEVKNRFLKNLSIPEFEEDLRVFLNDNQDIENEIEQRKL